MQCVILNWMDTNLKKLVVKRFGVLTGKVLNMRSLGMVNIRGLLLIFIRYNTGVVHRKMSLFKK